MIILILSMVFVSTGCGGNGEEGGKYNISLPQAYTHLNNNFVSLKQSIEAKREGTITRFDWNLSTATLRSGSTRVAEALEGREGEAAELLRKAAGDIVRLAEKYDQEIKTGEPADDEQLKRQISERLEKAKQKIKGAQERAEEKAAQERAEEQ